MNLKESLIQSLESSGWHILPESLDEYLQENSKINLQSLIKPLLDSDLKNIGSKYLPDGVVSGKSDTFEANGVLQLVKLRNIGAPKENEQSHSAPSLFKLTLTDGSTNINCLAMENIPNLSLNTPPGTKIQLTGEIKIKSNMVILFAKNVKILGGHVDYLVEKWKLTKDLSNYVRKMCMTDTAPPPWVPFGTRQRTQVDTSKKVFEEPEKIDDEINEFSEARKAIVAEALEAKSKKNKTFVQQNIDKSKIISEARPEVSVFSQPEKTKEPKKIKKGKFRDIDNEKDYSDKNNTARPPAAATLFDALKTRLNLEDEPKPEPPVETYEPRGFRGQRNQRGRYQQQTNNKPYENKQVYNPNDFNYELGGDANKASKMNDDFYYDPADFEDKPIQENKTKFRNNYEATSSNQSQKTGLNNFKTKINPKDEPKPEPPVDTYEPRGFRGQRNQRGRYQQQTNNKPYENKQVYNPNDFNYELGGDANKASKMNDDFYYDPADFENKPTKGSKTEFKNNYETTSSNQSQKTGLNNFKTKINPKDEPKPEPSVDTYEPRGFRGQRNQRGRYQQQTNNKPYENKQVYYPNDFNYELGGDANKASKMNDDFYYDPADFEDKPNKGSKTEFKNTFQATTLNQSQNRNSANGNFNNKIDYPSNQYETNMTFNRSQRSQQGYSNNNYYQNYEQQPNYRYNNRDDYGYYYDEYSNNQYDQEPRYQRGNNDYRQNSGNYGRSQNFHRRNY